MRKGERMATVNKIIETVDGMVPNTCEEETKFRWMAELDGMVAKQVMRLPEPPRYEYPRDMDRQFLIPEPYERVYELYMEAMIDLSNRDYHGYNNVITVFDAMFSKYRNEYIQDNRPVGAGNFKNW